ncbi:hypothetical protein F443_22692, partial [Phytophthora nicotianae P1569]
PVTPVAVRVRVAADAVVRARITAPTTVAVRIRVAPAAVREASDPVACAAALLAPVAVRVQVAPAAVREHPSLRL